jgi:ABC-type uncharacterized transport system permease subunit
VLASCGGKAPITGQSVRVQSGKERFEQAVDRSAKVAIGGALLGLPIAVLAAMGASTAVMLGYLILATIVLALVAARRRFEDVPLAVEVRW